MSNFSYDITLSAADRTEAQEKMKALTALAAKLSAKELKALANVVQNNPVQLAMAKKFLGL